MNCIGSRVVTRLVSKQRRPRNDYSRGPAGERDHRAIKKCAADGGRIVAGGFCDCHGKNFEARGRLSRGFKGRLSPLEARNQS